MFPQCRRQRFFILHLNMINDSEFLESVGKVCQIFSIQVNQYHTLLIYSWLLMILGFLRRIGNTFFNISFIIGGDKPFRNFWISVMRICILFICMAFSFAFSRSSLKQES